MNKRQIKKIAEDSLDRYRNDEFLQTLVGHGAETKIEKKPPVQYRRFAVALCSIILVLAVSLTGYYLGTSIVSNENYYQGINKVGESSAIESMNAELAYLSFDALNANIIRWYDEYTDTTLLYSITVDKPFEIFTCHVYLAQECAMNSTHYVYHDGNLHYNYNLSNFQNGVACVINAYIETPYEKLTIDYEGVSFGNQEEDVAYFLDLVDNIVKAK